MKKTEKRKRKRKRKSLSGPAEQVKHRGRDGFRSCNGQELGIMNCAGLNGHTKIKVAQDKRRFTEKSENPNPRSLRE
jgi:hypothetical protein